MKKPQLKVRNLACAIRQLFRWRIEVLTSWLQNPPVPGEPPEISTFRHPDILNLQLAVMEPPSQYFHYAHRERIITFSNRFCEAWARQARFHSLSGLDLYGVFDTFMIHEIQHLRQGLTSDKYSDVPNFLAGLRRVDYNADAVSAVVCCYLYDRFRPMDWSPGSAPTAMARVIKMALANMEVFDALHSPFPQNGMSNNRFCRYLTWHLQLARAKQWPPEHELFDLRDEPLVEIDGLTENVGIWEVPPEHLKMFFTSGTRIYRFRADDSQFAKNLILGVLNADYDLTSRCFDEVFAAHPDLVGRDPKV